MGDIDTAGLKANFALVARHGPDEVAQYFYSYLFLRYPQTRDMFPPAMTKQRDRLVGALVRIVTNVDQVDRLVPYLEDLGRDHRKFGTLAGHYPAVGEALLTTLRHFSGPAWTETVSTALVRSSTPGDQVRLGPPFGRMTLDPETTRPLLMIAGSTGLAPMKALIGQIARGGGRTTHLYLAPAASARSMTAKPLPRFRNGTDG